MDDSRLAIITQSWPDAIIAETDDGVVTSWNRAAEDLYGYRPEEIVGRSADLLYPAEHRAEEAANLRRVAGGGSRDEYPARRVHRDGSDLTVWVRAWSIVDGLGSSLVTVSREVVEPGGDPSGRELGHRLRTPLQAIIGFTGTLLLRMPGPLNEEQERQLLLIQASGQKLLSLINELGR